MIEMYHMEIRKKESENMTRADEMCNCDVRRRMDLGLIPPSPMVLDGFIKVCPWCNKINPSWVKQQKAEEKREKEAMVREKVLDRMEAAVNPKIKEKMMKVEEAVNPMARPVTMEATHPTPEPEKKAEEPKPQARRVWVVVRILRGLEGTSDICVFDTKEKAEDFRRALSMADTYDCVTRMYEREVIE